MATYTEVGNRVRAQIRRAGHPSITETHDSMKAAKKWAQLKEAEIDAARTTGLHGKTGVTLGQAIDQYMKEKPDLAKSVVSALKSIKVKLGDVMLSKLTDDHIVKYIDGKDFGPATGAFHFANLSSVLTMARVGWRYHVADFMKDARARLNILGLIGKSEERKRRPTADEIERLLSFKYPPKTPMADIIRFAISSSMRRAEITRIKHATFNEVEKTIVITDRKHPTKKNGNHQTVPLLDESVEIIKRQPKKKFDDNVFPFSPEYIGEIFIDTCKALGIEDLHFHDLRHEATSRLFEMGYQIHEVAMFTGHEDWESLKRYTQLKAKDIRRVQDAEKAEPVAIEAAPAGIDMAEFEEFKQFQKMKKMMAQMKEAEAA